jgi:S-adenosylmethionine:tRNA ribosyltransferase-isomerase
MKAEAAARLSPPVPDNRAAGEPPEARGIARDQVKLLVAHDGVIEHDVFRNLGEYLDPGDLLVVNTSGTLPAAVDGTRNGEPIVVNFSNRLDNWSWAIELRAPDRSGPLLDGTAGETIGLAEGVSAEILSADGIEGRSRILRARLSLSNVDEFLTRVGRPISYSYVPETWPLSMYQTVFAREPGSAEMPSAGRPFTTELVTELVARGVAFAPIVLHTGVSSFERGERPVPERMRVPALSARFVNGARAAGRRVIAVGTTVVRALESAATPEGFVKPVEGWTDLVLGPDQTAKIVDGLVTGWHAPDSSHRQLLEAVLGAEHMTKAYEAALDHGYLWHEFGDAALLFSENGRRSVLSSHTA